MSLIAPPAKLTDSRTRKWPLLPVLPRAKHLPLSAAAWWSTTPEQQAPGPRQREAILASAVITGASKYRHAKSQTHGNYQGGGPGRKHHGHLRSRCGSKWAAPALHEQHLLGEGLLINNN